MAKGDRRLETGFLFTDHYQLSMAQLYFREGLADKRVAFDYFFRAYPDYGHHQAGYCVFAGLEWLIDWMAEARCGTAEIERLRNQRGSSGQPVFEDSFLEWLEAEGNFDPMTLRSVAEGRLVHPHVPLSTVEGPLALAQILETPLLNQLNYQTLIATKASRIAESARGGTVLEFGMRRGPHLGVNAGARAALIGGAEYTSNVAASARLGLPSKGTHGHSMVQVYMALGGGELEAFRAYASAYPDDCTLLVDTIDTLDSGIPNAITVFGELRAAGHEPRGVRLDSGDLAYLSIQAAKRLDQAGFGDVAIVLSNNLDELAIWQILAQIDDEAQRYGVEAAKLARRLVYGVGTRLITSHGHGALDGVFKLVAVDQAGEMIPSLKLSDNPEKIPIPGAKSVWRIYDRRGYATADVVASVGERPGSAERLELHHPYRAEMARVLSNHEVQSTERLLGSVLAGGARADSVPTIDELRRRRAADLERLDPGVRRLVNPHTYHVSLTSGVKAIQQRLVDSARDGRLSG